MDKKFASPNTLTEKKYVTCHAHASQNPNLEIILELDMNVILTHLRLRIRNEKKIYLKIQILKILFFSRVTIINL